MPIAFEPWQHYPSLTLERLTAIAALMRDTRNSTVLLHDEAAGDTPWSLGCRVYSRTLAAIRAAASSTPWLHVLHETHPLRFTFSIGSLPIKFYKGDPEDVPGKAMVRSFAELRQMSLALEMEGVKQEYALRLAIESDFFHNTSAITLVEVDEQGKPYRVFEIPLDASNVVVMQTKPIDLAPPVLTVIREESEEVKRGAVEHKVGSAGGES